MQSTKQLYARELFARSSYGALAIAAAMALFAGQAHAMQPPATTPAPKPAVEEDTQVEGVIVTGFRASVQSSLETKRESDVMVDAITAEDIADFPDSNLAESLQRLPGISIDRFDGEGRTITVRGLGGDFTRTRLNGLEALSTAGANEFGGTVGINRSRSFDYNTFASELFNSLKVQKSSSAETDEGSLGATVDLVTGKPFAFKGQRAALSIQDAYYEAGQKNNPRITGLYSNRWADGRIGFLVSGAYSERDQTIDSYSRQAASFDFAYRGSTFAGTPNPTAAIPVVIQRQGFAAPAGAACNGTPAGPASTAVVPGLNITNQLACDAQRGSDPTAYNLIHTVIGAQRTRDPITGAIVTSSPGSLIRIPGLPTLNQQQVNQERLGLTAAFQVRPRDGTLITVDGVFSRMSNDSQQFQISTIGTNRNNTVAGYDTLTAATPDATKVGFYTNVSCRAPNTAVVVDCGAGPILPGMAVSRNPNNLEAYDYYNNPTSVGYIAPAPGGITGIAQLDRLIGRPSTKIIEAALSPSGQNADYIKLGNLDFRSADDESKYTTKFTQWSTGIEQDITDDLRANLLVGHSESVNKGQGILSDFIRLDSGNGTPGNDYYIFDERGSVKMPKFSAGFNAADPTAWDTVKGYSVLRTFERNVTNKYDNGRLDFIQNLAGEDQLKFGLSGRKYTFSTTETRRAGQETANPTLKEAGKTTADVGRVINWGEGLDVPAGTTTAFFVPDNKKMMDVFDFNCNCINKWGDFRKSALNGAGSAAGNFDVSEKDTGGYLQYDYDTDLDGHRLRGNVGARYAKTEVDAKGLSSFAPFAKLSDSNSYNDFLPSINVVYELMDNVLLRGAAAKVIARPNLGLMAPGFNSITIPTEIGATAGGFAQGGNTRLEPIRAKNYDVALEWYPSRDATLGVALFDKEIDNFQQIVLSSHKLSEILTPEGIAALRASQTAATAQAYIDADFDFDVRRPQDTPGGYVRGVELNYQQNLTFLPSFWKNFGILANYTHIKSELKYIVDPGQAEIKNLAGVITTPARPVVLANGPYLNASPDAVNLTVFYEVEKWSARVSTSYRTGYFSKFPLSPGTCDPGFCDAPTLNDFESSKPTTNVDASFSYKLNSHVGLSLEMLNLTNQTDNRFAYQSDPVVTRYASSGRQYFLGLRATY